MRLSQSDQNLEKQNYLILTSTVKSSTPIKVPSHMAVWLMKATRETDATTVAIIDATIPIALKAPVQAASMTLFSFLKSRSKLICYLETVNRNGIEQHHYCINA